MTTSKKKKEGRQERDWNALGEKFTQDPNCLWLCPNISLTTKAVFHVVLMHNPSFPSFNRIAEILKIHKDDAACSVYELLARKILIKEKNGAGRLANLYLVKMAPLEWDLLSEAKNLLWEGRAVVRKLRFSVGKKVDFKKLRFRVAKKGGLFGNFVAPTGGQEKRCGPNGGPQRTSCGPSGGPQNEFVAPTGGPIYINPHTNGEINMGKEKERPALLDGPPPFEEKGTLREGYLGQYLARELPLGPTGLVQKGGVIDGRKRVIKVNEHKFRVGVS